MSLSEPRRSRWNLRWRMFGTPIRIHPLFWASSALLGVRYYQDPGDGGVSVFIFWMIAVFLCILLHDFGHVVVARLFGVHGGILLTGFGGQMLGLAELPRRWQRLLVLLAGPLTSLLIVVILLAITLAPFPEALKERGWAEPVVNGMRILMLGNFWWGLLNVLPLWPLDGGRIAAEMGEAMLGQRGRSLTALLSIVAAGLLTVWVLLEMRVQPELLNRFDIRYPLYLEYYAILILFCFALWLSSFRALWGDPQPSV